MYTLQQIEAVIAAAHNVLANEDATGCSDDLTVTSSSACDTLRDALDALKPHTVNVVMHHHRWGVSTLAVLVPEGVPFTFDDAINLLAENYEQDKEEWGEVARFGDNEVKVFAGTCKKCGSTLDDSGWCVDETCVFNDWSQIVPLSDLNSMNAKKIEAKHGTKKRNRVES